MTATDELLDLQDEQERKKSQYISKRDLLIAAPVLVLLSVCVYFLYQKLLSDAEETICTKNLKDISQALGLYFASNGDCYPPAFAVGDGGAPLYDQSGQKVYSWVYLVSPGMNARGSFKCPTAEEGELVKNVIPPDVAEAHRAGSRDKVLEEQILSSYGFYRLWELQPVNYMGDPTTQIVVAETANRGAGNTFDPHPIEGPGGELQPYDGYMIGWDTGNDALAQNSKFVSRLALPDTRGGAFKRQGPARHGDHIKALAGDGHVTRLSSSSALIQRTGGQAVGHWGDR